jgi:beta-glucanase (GH16 family)
VDITTTLVPTNTDPLALPGQVYSNTLLQVDSNVAAWGGLTHHFENEAIDTWVPQDWSSYEGVSFWLYGQNTGATVFFEIQDNRNPGSTVDDTEIWSYPFTDDFSGWQYFEVPFDDFARKEIGNGAPNDGFGRTEVHGWAFGSLTVNTTYYLDNVALVVRSTTIDDFEDGQLPYGLDGDGLDIGFFTWGDGGTTVDITTTLVPTNTDPLALPCQVYSNTLLQVDSNVAAWGGLTHHFENEAIDTWVPQDWSSYEGVSFWLYGQNTGATVFFEIQDNRNPGSTVDDTEIWSYPFTDDFSGWQYFEVPFDDFARKEIGNGAPNDGFGRTEVHGWAFGSLTVNTTYYLDNIEIYGNIGTAVDLQVSFAASEFEVVEGQTALISVALNVTSTEPVIVSYKTAESRAIPDRDYVPVSGTLVIPAGSKAQTFAVETLQDGKYEGDERVALHISDPQNAALGVLQRAVLLIVDDDVQNPALLDDFEGFHRYATGGNVTLDITEIAAGSPLELPGQGAYENVLSVDYGAGRLAANGVGFDRTFGESQDWSGYEGLSFWYYGSNSGETITVQLYDNQAATTSEVDPAEWVLAWSDEFDDEAGTLPDPSKWSYEIGDGALNGILGWGNGELEFYTDSPDNAATDGLGNLVITAREVDTTTTELLCWYGPCEYTSARLITSQKAEFAYGRIEARIQVPFGQGIWPAFWSLGNDIDEVDWPTCGEIDVMENIGSEPATVHGTIHGPGYSGGNPVGGGYDLPTGNLSDEFHTFAIEWAPDQIRWFIDNTNYFTATVDDIPGGTEWVFDHAFFLLLNVAVGGNWPGMPDETSTFPQTMHVDYVRVYQAANTAERFEATFVDNFSGWKKITLRFDAFTRSASQPAGAPDDGLGLTEVWGYGFALPSAGSGSFYLDQVSLEAEVPLYHYYFPMVRKHN